MLDYVAPPTETQTFSSSGGRVLLVDDDRIGIQILKALLESLGYCVDTAENGADAYALLREDPGCVDLVVTDRLMPVMDGLALTRRLKRDPKAADIPIVILTGAMEVDEIASGIEAGAFYYLSKPVIPEIVRSVLDSAMQRSRRMQVIAEKPQGLQAGFANVQILRTTLSKASEVERVCRLLANVHPHPETVIQGIYELVQNAVEHGLLRFNRETKERLLSNGTWLQAMADRARDPAYGHGIVEANMLRRPDSLVLTVKDPGPGFDWKPCLVDGPPSPSALCGRGIARAVDFIFDGLTYNEAGNEATAIMQLRQAFRC
ncbi:response regulator [Agrobacterium sp. ES01]|uniref:response regulator n=1 Tax=Agrobacterium sp. ES01 TaxID=3420714 RepID=UPI003D11CC07